MAVFVLASVRSCATTTSAVALAATWPAPRRVLVVELDPAGGTFAAALGWPAQPSLVSLGAAARHRSDPEAVWAHCRSLPGGASVLTAPPSGTQVRSATATLAGLLGRLGELDADVIIDVGRLDAGLCSPLLGLPGPAGTRRVALTSRPRLADLNALVCVLEQRSDEGSPLFAGRLGLVLVGDGPYADAEVAEAMGVEVLGRLPWDPEAAELLGVVSASDRRLRLSPLVRAARSLAETLAPEPTLVPAAVAEAPSFAARLRVRLGRPERAPLAVPPAAGVATNGSVPGGGPGR
ncbi:MAG: hypothetical protein M0029_01225 [Actinomycetota bacterium]|nr:hypothetical protein [Actinomycetota bacterium]